MLYIVTAEIIKITLRKNITSGLYISDFYCETSGNSERQVTIYHVVLTLSFLKIPFLSGDKDLQIYISD